MKSLAHRPGWQRDDQRTRARFARLARRHAGSAQAADWESRASQELRFRVLAEVGNLKGASVLDVGCGAADLADWLAREGLACRYRGVDLCPEALERARDYSPALNLGPGSVLDLGPADAADWVLASGLFYLRRAQPAEFLREAVERMYAACRRGLSFNSLSTWAVERAAGEYHADPLHVLEMCRALSPRVALRHDYHPRDFTLYIYKEAP